MFCLGLVLHINANILIFDENNMTRSMGGWEFLIVITAHRIRP